MTAKTEGRHPGEFLLSEANGYRSRETVTILGGYGGSGIVPAGTVLGKITSGGKYQPSPATGSDGSQIGIAVLMYPVDATEADVEAVVIARDAEVNGKVLSYAASVDDGSKKAAKATQLAAVGIIVR